jgi:hypothetical protein
MTVSEVGHNGVAAAARVVDAYPESLVHELQAWRIAREAASRCNRNLLQYAAGLAAVLGISAGGGGMIAVASALETKLGEGEGLLQVTALIGPIVAATIVGGRPQHPTAHPSGHQKSGRFTGRYLQGVHGGSLHLRQIQCFVHGAGTEQCRLPLYDCAAGRWRPRQTSRLPDVFGRRRRPAGVNHRYCGQLRRRGVRASLLPRRGAR